MEKKVLAAASYAEQKYFLEPAFDGLPDTIKDEIKIVCVVLAQKLCCTFLLGFYEDGEIYFETVVPRDMIDFDEIGAELEIKALKQDKAELWKALKLWFLIFKTDKGGDIKEELEAQAERKTE